ncbi:hypothetical protein BGZ74_001200 [Mortierella antarctica]|nr:hypothetical protein BGZ74_001200 [Mortierella antarctica]
MIGNSSIKLFCLVDGESTSSIFPAKLSSDESIGDLKELIKTKKAPRFDDVAADELTLWRVSIPITDDDELPILLDTVTDEDKKKLGPVTSVSEVFPDDIPGETINIIVQRPPSDTAAEIPTVGVFTVTIRGKTPATLQWITDTATATLDELRDDIYAKHPSLNSPSLSNGLRAVAIDKSDCSVVLYLESDEELRAHLRTMLRDGAQHIPIRLEGRPRPFSEFTSTDTDRIYGSESHNFVGALSYVGSTGSAPLTSPNYIQAVGDLLVSLKAAVKAAWPGKSECSEPGYALYVALFLIHAVGLFPELILIPNKAISGRRGTGCLDYAIVSNNTPVFQ